MATNKRALAICDSCGMRYPHRVMRKSSYNTLRCPECFDANFDLKNHPQNRVADVRDDLLLKTQDLMMVVEMQYGIQQQ